MTLITQNADGEAEYLPVPMQVAILAEEIVYEHRLCPDDPTRVEVRAMPADREADGHSREGCENWRTYWVCATPQEARRVVALLHPEDFGAQVTP